MSAVLLSTHLSLFIHASVHPFIFLPVHLFIIPLFSLNLFMNTLVCPFVQPPPGRPSIHPPIPQYPASVSCPLSVPCAETTLGRFAQPGAPHAGGGPAAATGTTLLPGSPSGGPGYTRQWQMMCADKIGVAKMSHFIINFYITLDSFLSFPKVFPPSAWD